MTAARAGTGGVESKELALDRARTNEVKTIVAGHFALDRNGAGTRDALALERARVRDQKTRPRWIGRVSFFSRPYSATTVMTEYFDRFDVPGGDSLLVVSTEIVDPEYLATPYWTSTHFKRQADAAGWNPTSCAAR